MVIYLLCTVEKFTIGNLFHVKHEKLTIGHVAVLRDQLNYITNVCTHMCTSLTDHVISSISYPEKLLSCRTASLARAPKNRRLE